jgi:methyltransferase-like protein/trans-aconitate methyltransferase
MAVEIQMERDLTVSPGENTYDQLPYPKWTHQETHPRQLEATAALFGMQPAAISQCRVLELGCAAGWNLVPMAEDQPNSTFVGIDLSASQISQARALATAAGVENVRLEQADILDVDASWGLFDYIICHGTYSWVPGPVREKILSICKDNLAVNGVALISYNIYPGWHFRGMIRDMMLYGISDNAGPAAQVSDARKTMDFLAENCLLSNTYASVLQDEVGLINDSPDAQIFHDQLEHTNHPVYFHQFMGQAEAHGLQYLADAQFSRTPLRFLPKSTHEALAHLDIIQQEQYMDFLLNRSFRRTMLAHRDVALETNPHAETMRGFHVAMAVPLKAEQIDLDSDSGISFKLGALNLASAEPIVKGAIYQLAKHRPEAIPFDDLHVAALRALPSSSRARYSGQELAGKKELALWLMIFRGAGIVHAWLHPPPGRSQISGRPKALRVARLQAREGKVVTNSRHELMPLDDTERHLVTILDGEHDSQALIDSLRDACASGAMSIEGGQTDGETDRQRLQLILEKTLVRLRDVAVLVG